MAEEASKPAEEAAADPVEKVAAAIRNISTAAGKTAPGQKSEARNAMLEALVYGDNDLVGLIAYAMHEVNRRDWTAAYEAGNGRPPSEGEIKAYLVGEQLERRLDTYRRLAEDALAKIANPDQNMRKLAEPAPEPPRAAASPAPLAAPARPAPMPAPAPIPRSFEVSPADQAVSQPPKRKNWGGFVFYLLLLLVAVVVLGYVIRSGISLPSMSR